MAGGPYDHHRARVDELVGQAARMSTAGTELTTLHDDLVERGNAVLPEVQGPVLTAPAATATTPTATAATELGDASRLACGTLLLYAEAVRTFDATVDQLNREHAALPSPKPPADVAALDRRHGDAEALVDDAAREASRLLEGGPTAAVLDDLGRRGLLPIGGDDDPALRSAFAKTGHDFPHAAFPVDELSPQEVAAWWAGLTLAERLAVMNARPARLGNTDGLPAEARDEANRIALAQDLEDLERLEAQGRLTERQEQQLADVRRIEAQLRDAEDHVDPVTGEPTGAQLYVYQPGEYEGEGRAAIVTGDADTADDVAWNVPGTDSDVANLDVGRSGAIYDAARLDSLGARRLAVDVDGLVAARGDDQPHTTVIGHSYGSTTVARAGAEEGLGDDVDELVLVGSPGASSAEQASDLGVGADHVFVGANSSDPVTYLGGMGYVSGPLSALGQDPSSDDFGAVRFQAEATDRATWVGFDDHSKYFTPGSESLTNIAQVVNGDLDDVVRAEHRYDPWYDEPQDPERDRTPTEGS